MLKLVFPKSFDLIVKGNIRQGANFVPNNRGKKGGFVSLYKQIEWDHCGDSTYCKEGKYMQDTYHLDGKVIGQFMGYDPIPEGWALAWMWNEATEESSDFLKIDVPQGGE